MPLCKASSTRSLPNAQWVQLWLNRHKLSSCFLGSESFGVGATTAWQCSLGFLGGGSDEKSTAPWKTQKGQRLHIAGSEARGEASGTGEVTVQSGHSRGS